MSKEENNCKFCNDIYLNTKIKIGDKVPDVSFKVFYKNDEKKIKISDFEGKWLILFFYPADFTFVCPTELEEMANLYEEFKKEGAEVISVSTDTVYVHKAWHDASQAVGKIKFPMAEDTNHTLSELFGVLIEDEGLALRGSFIINPDGVLKAMEINDNSIGRSANELLRKLQAAKFTHQHSDKVCPASWKPGDDTLEPSLDLVGKI